MDYREVEPPESLRLLVKVGWTLSIPDDSPGWVSHVATPDGCMEIIHRLSGRSQWNGEQPDQFVAGAITQPTQLTLGAGSSFVGLRLWPWAWQLLSGGSPAVLIDRWAPLAEAAPDFCMPSSVEASFASIGTLQPPPAMSLMASAILSASSAGEIGRLAGLSPRVVQRWFQANVGQPPRSYLRMLRFSEAFSGLPEARRGLADHALGHGFADQAHMAREFRALAGAPARQAKERASGPFIRGK